jgi:hypothetical protein
MGPPPIRSPRATTGRQDRQAAKAKPLARNCLRVLDQGLGPTRARSRTNRPLEKPCTIAGPAQGWAGHPVQSRRIQLTSHQKPDPDVDTPRLVTRWANRIIFMSFHNFILEYRSPSRDASADRSRPLPVCCPHQTGRPIPGRVDSWSTRSIRIHNGQRPPGTTDRPRACRWVDSPAHREGEDWEGHNLWVLFFLGAIKTRMKRSRSSLSASWEQDKELYGFGGALGRKHPDQHALC